MKCLQTILLLTEKLEQEKKSKEANEKYFAEHAGGKCLADFCRNIAMIEDLEEAIKILKNNNQKG